MKKSLSFFFLFLVLVTVLVPCVLTAAESVTETVPGSDVVGALLGYLPGVLGRMGDVGGDRLRRRGCGAARAQGQCQCRLARHLLAGAGTGVKQGPRGQCPGRATHGCAPCGLGC